MRKLDFNEYQALASETAEYPTLSLKGRPISTLYPALGLAGEAGEVAENIKRIIRDDDGVTTHERTDKLIKELGDCTWYISQIAKELGIPFNTIAITNLEKLHKRAEHGVIHGEGDSR